jgi:hypothetical protein
MSFDLMAQNPHIEPMLSSSPASTHSPIMAIRLATADDVADVIRLARLDQKAAPSGRVLLGIVDGEVHAAAAVETGYAVADPFVPTADLVALLRHRASRLRGELAPAAGPSSLLRALFRGRRRRVTSTA